MTQIMETPALLLLNIVMMIMNLGAVSVNAGMLWCALGREAKIADSDHAARQLHITVRRATRMEAGFLICQIILFVMSVWALTRVLPSAPHQAITFYFVTQFGRSMVSVILAVISLLDLRDRRRLIILNRLVQETTA
jgi:hypothetical protein